MNFNVDSYSALLKITLHSRLEKYFPESFSKDCPENRCGKSSGPVAKAEEGK
jgi:hypothetical protein